MGYTISNGSLTEVYVHWHAKNVGKGYPHKGRSKTDNQIVNLFSAQRENVRKAAMTQLRSKVAQNLVSLNEDKTDLINAAFLEGQLSDEQLLSSLDKELKNIFENIIPTKLLQDVMIQEQKMADIDYTGLRKKGEEGFKVLSDILTIISDTARLFDSTGKELATYLTLNEYQGDKTITGLSNYIINKLRQFQKKMNGTQLDVIGAKEVAAQLERSLFLIKRVYQGRIKPNDITRTIGTSLENNLFATSFAEWGAAKANDIAFSGANDIITSVVGQNKGQMAYYNPEGRFVKEGGRLAQNKVDILTEGVSVNITESLESLKMTVGISNKFYRTQGFKGLNDKKVTISAGGGGTINQAVTAIAGNDVSELKYLMYNTIAYGNYFSNSFQELKNLVTLRQVLTMLSARSKDDFAQVFYINGYVITIYEIMSMLIEDIDHMSNIITLQGFTPVFQGDTGETKDTVYNGSIERASYVHKRLKQKGISGELHLTNLMAMRKS